MYFADVSLISTYSSAANIALLLLFVFFLKCMLLKLTLFPEGVCVIS